MKPSFGHENRGKFPWSLVISDDLAANSVRLIAQADHGQQAANFKQKKTCNKSAIRTKIMAWKFKNLYTAFQWASGPSGPTELSG